MPKPSKGEGRPKNTPVTWASLAICVVVGTGLVTYYRSEKERRQTQVTMSSQTKTIGKAAIGGPWSLFNTEGRLVTDADYRGRFQFVYFGFTRCPDICPNELVKIGSIFETLNSNPKVKGRIKPLFISIGEVSFFSFFFFFFLFFSFFFFFSCFVVYQTHCAARILPFIDMILRSFLLLTHHVPQIHVVTQLIS
jgi:hypothetical protein